MAGYQDDVIGLRGVRSAQHGVDIGDFGWFRDAIGRLFGEGVGFDLQTSTAFFGVALEFGFDPFAGGSDSLACFDGFLVLRGDCGAVVKANQLFDRLPDVVRGGFFDSLRNVGIGVAVGG